jgi:hypothetical protein
MNLVASVALLLSLWQGYPRPLTEPIQPTVPATFTGIFRGIESGHVVIEVDSGQNMRMFVTGSTKFIRDGKPSKANQFHDGDAVSVEAQRDLRMNLVALRVEAVKPKTPKPDGEPDKPN